MSASTPVFVVRHAKAGRRRDWDGPDQLRPLSKAGARQASGIARLLGDRHVSRIVSSPFVRCGQTVEPLARALRLSVEQSTALAEGADHAEAMRLVQKVADEPTVLCTHGDVILDLLDHLHDDGVVNGDLRLEKGSTWVLDLDCGAVTAATYLPPPDPPGR